MIRWIKWIAIIPLFLGMDQLIRTQTDGFRTHKLSMDIDPNPKWEIDTPLPPKKIFNQTFTYLGSGAQSYAFLGSDQKTVLKVFKHYHLPPSTKSLQKLPLPSWLSPWREKVIGNRKSGVEHMYTSAILSYKHLFAQTGMQYAKINPIAKHLPTIEVRDKIGVIHKLYLNQIPFIIQSKAIPFSSYLEKHPDEAESLFDSLFACIAHRTSLGIANSDPSIRNNLGVINGKVVEIDIGSFTKMPILHENLTKQLENIKQLIKSRFPHLLDSFNRKLAILDSKCNATSFDPSSS